MGLSNTVATIPGIVGPYVAKAIAHKVCVHQCDLSAYTHTHTHTHTQGYTKSWNRADRNGLNQYTNPRNRLDRKGVVLIGKSVNLVGILVGLIANPETK